MEIVLSIKSKSDGSVKEVKHELLGRGLVVGRGAEGGVLLEGLDLSREHLVLTTDGTDIYVEDLSVNGTWLNGKRLHKSFKTRVRAEDSIELPGYALTARLVTESEEAIPESISQPPGPILEDTPNQALAPIKSGPLAALDPVFGFIGSLSFMEKFLVIVGITGLLLLYTYISS